MTVSRVTRALLSAALFSACADSGTAPRLDVAIAPLTLAGVGVVCYDLDVANGDGTVWSKGDPLWTRLGVAQSARSGAGVLLRESDPSGPADGGTVCSNQYGNGAGGGITYIGTCDADSDSNPNRDGVQNTVTLWVDGLYDGDVTGDIGEWRDPCVEGCTLDVDCNENADSLVEFNLTIMRAAKQGFFDIAVNFQDIFCSAKLDTCYADGRHNELLFGADSERDWTAVFGFACTAGPGNDVVTNLMYGPVTVTCGAAPNQTVFAVDPAAQEGNNEVTVGGHTLHYGVYRNHEQLSCDGQPCQKVFWNLAFSIDDLAAIGGNCHLGLEATVDDAADDAIVFEDGLPSGDGLAYPYIVVDNNVTIGGQGRCQANALDDEDSNVTTTYFGNANGLASPVSMCTQYAGAANPTATGACDDGPTDPVDPPNPCDGIDCGGVNAQCTVYVPNNSAICSCLPGFMYDNNYICQPIPASPATGMDDFDNGTTDFAGTAQWDASTGQPGTIYSFGNDSLACGGGELIHTGITRSTDFLRLSMNDVQADPHGIFLGGGADNIVAGFAFYDLGGTLKVRVGLLSVDGQTRLGIEANGIVTWSHSNELASNTHYRLALTFTGSSMGTGADVSVFGDDGVSSASISLYPPVLDISGLQNGSIRVGMYLGDHSGFSVSNSTCSDDFAYTYEQK